MPDAVQQAVDGLMVAFEEFKATNDARLAEIERKGAADPVVTDKLARIEATLNQFESINQKLTAAQLQAKAAQERDDELKTSLEKIELRLNRPGAGGHDAKADRKAYFADWARGVTNALVLGEANLGEGQRKAIELARAECKSLSVQTDTTGGYLAPPEYVREIIKGVTEMSPVRQLVRVRQTASKSIQLPKRTGQFAAQWVAEQGTRTETAGLTWGMEEIPCHEMFALIDISQQNLEDSAFDLEAEIRAEAEEQFALAEGTAVVTGSGVGKPLGWQNAGLTSTNSGTATTVADAGGQGNGLVTLFHSLKTAYTRNASWAMNRLTLGSVRKLQDTTKQYLWMPGLANGMPNTILGAPYVEIPDMPNEGANTYPIAFGDFNRAYTLVDRIAMTMLRDPFTQAASGNIRFMFRRRLGGQVVLSEALTQLKCST